MTSDENDPRLPTRRAFVAGLAGAALFASASAALAAPPLMGTRSDGEPATAEAPGGWRLVYFGYTHCPDVCPTGLQTMSDAITALGPLGERISPVFVTVDPERDPPKVMRDYVAFFHPRMIGITPSPEDLKTMGKAWRVKFARVDVPGHDYLMDHTAAIFLVDPGGEIAGRFPHDLTSDKLADRIRGVFLERAG